MSYLQLWKKFEVPSSPAITEVGHVEWECVQRTLLRVRRRYTEMPQDWFAMFHHGTMQVITYATGAVNLLCVLLLHFLSDPCCKMQIVV